MWNSNSAGIHLFKVGNGIIRAMCKICSKLTIKQQNNVNDVVLVSLLLSLNRSHNCSGVSIFEFEHTNASWDNSCWKFSKSRGSRLHFFNRIIVLENWQNSQEDTCGGFFLVKLQTRLTTLLKQDTILDVFLLTLRNFQNTLVAENLSRLHSKERMINCSKELFT